MPVMAAGMTVSAKIRQQHKGAEAFIRHDRDDATGPLLVEFVEKQAAVTPGQTVVFYAGDVVVGSGVIASSVPE